MHLNSRLNTLQPLRSNWAVSVGVTSRRCLCRRKFVIRFDFDFVQRYWYCFILHQHAPLPCRQQAVIERPRLQQSLFEILIVIHPRKRIPLGKHSKHPKEKKRRMMSASKKSSSKHRSSQREEESGKQRHRDKRDRTPSSSNNNINMGEGRNDGFSTGGGHAATSPMNNHSGNKSNTPLHSPSSAYTTDSDYNNYTTDTDTDDNFSPDREQRYHRTKSPDNGAQSVTSRAVRSHKTANSSSLAAARNSRIINDESVQLDLPMADLMAYLQVVANNSSNLPLTRRDDPELGRTVSSLTSEEYALKCAAFIPANVRILGGMYGKYGSVWDLPTSEVSFNILVRIYIHATTSSCGSPCSNIYCFPQSLHPVSVSGV